MNARELKLQEIFQNVNGASFISIDTLTGVTLAGGKKNPHQGRITKASTGASVMVFQNKKTNAYENMVKRRLEAEGKSADDFQLSPRKWGTRVPETPFVTHKDALYLEVIFLKPGKSTLLLDGLPMTEKQKAEIEGLPDDEKDEGPEIQGGLSAKNQVIIRTFKADSVIRVRVDKEEHVL